MQLNRWLLLFTLLLHQSQAELGPCRKRVVGDALPCGRNEDCVGSNTVCLNSNCTCAENFDTVKQAGNPPKYSCKPAPDDIGAVCNLRCKRPLVCVDEKCKCYGQPQGTKCVPNCLKGQTVDAKLNCIDSKPLKSACKQESDCTTPFATCLGGVCKCLQGTTDKGTYCELKCADGTPATKSCKRLFDGNRALTSAFDKDDTCSKDEFCATFGKPSVGLCCPLRCPYGNAVTTLSCEEGAPAGSQCPRDTHVCYSLRGYDFSNTLCCPRPCHEPTPLYLDGACLPRSFLGDSCVNDQQCEGGVTMACVAGKCQCLDATYTPKPTSKFPTCEKICAPGASTPVGRFCNPIKTAVGSSCYLTAECPVNTECRDSKCVCKCGYSVVNGICSLPAAPVDLSSISGLFGGGTGGLLGGLG